MKIAAVTCHKDPDSIRAQNLRAGLKADKRVKLRVVKNHYPGLLRYPEVVWQLINLRLHQNPAAYLVTYKSLAILPFVLWLAGERPVVFDEYSVPLQLTDSDLPTRDTKGATKYFLLQFAKPLYRRLLRHCRYILAGSEAQAELSARNNHLNLRQYCAVPLGADEEYFKPSKLIKNELSSLPFQVYYSAQATDTTELEMVLKVAEGLKTETDIEFVIVDGGRPVARAIALYQGQGAHVTHKPSLQIKERADLMNRSALVMAGPLGPGQASKYLVSAVAYASLASGVAAVVSRNPVSEALLTDKEDCLMIEGGSQDDLFQVISWAHQHREEIVDIGRNGRKQYERNLSVSCINSDITEVVDELIVAD